MTNDVVHSAFFPLHPTYGVGEEEWGSGEAPGQHHPLDPLCEFTAKTK